MDSRLIRLVRFALALCLCHLAGVASERRTAADWGGFLDGSRFAHRPTGTSPASAHRDELRADSVHSWDALRYQVDLDLELNPAWLEVDLTLDLRVRESLDLLDLHLRGYEIQEVVVNGATTPWTRAGDQLGLDLSAHPAAPGDSLQVRLHYSGTPITHDGTGLFVSPQMAYTLSDPWGTRNWIACFDEPFDKALWRVSVRADSSLSTLSNGVLEDVACHGDGTCTWSYRHDSPMSSYLVSIVTGHLSRLQDEWNGLPLNWFVYPQHVAAAQQAVSRMDQMLDCFSGYWGAYPFESYAMGEAPIYGGMGGMEHQTCTTIGDGLIAGGLQYESIIAHELSHMWWGDSVTPLDFRQVWLNEGWATYAEALYFQHLAAGDEEVFLDYLEQIQRTYLNWDSQFLPIFNPPVDDIFNISQYEKAASVLHMLRDLLGPAIFDEAQRTWQAEHRHGTVDTQEYQAALEIAGGLDLEEFFQQWIYTGGYPSYQHITEVRQQEGGCLVHLTVNQSHPRLDHFRARVPVRVVTSLVTLDTLLWVEQPSLQLRWALPGLFDTLLFNHRNTVLCRHQALPPQPGPPMWQVRACHLDDSQNGNGDGDLAQGESAWLALDVENVGGWDTNVLLSLSSTELDCGGSWPLLPDAGGGMQFRLPWGHVSVGGWDSPERAFVDLLLHSSSDMYPEQTSAFRLPVGDPALRLATSAGQAALRGYYQPELDSLLAFSDSLVTDTDLPEPAALSPGGLIWFTGAAGQSLSSAELAWLIDYTTYVGKAFVGGQDAWDSAVEPCVFRPVQADVPEVLVEGVAGTPFEGLTALLIGSGGAQNQSAPSSLEFCPGADVCSSQVFAVYANSREPAMLGYEICDGPLVLLGAGFGLEAISGLAQTSSRREWLAAVLEILHSDVRVRPQPEPLQPASPRLGRPWPNPFNPLTHIPFTLPQAGPLRLSVHDLLGREQLCLWNGPQGAGEQELLLDGSALASGLYLVTLEAGGRRETRKVLLLK